jgi:predicted phosphate transport protein (TIGR00153 family)
VAVPGRRYLSARIFRPVTCPRTTVRFLPREEEFFDLFVQVATRNKEAARLLRDLFDAAPERRTPVVEAIKRLEHEADQLTHEVVNRLDRTFITPLDREDIHQLASDLDDVMDAIDGTARRAQIFRLRVPPPPVKVLVEVIERMVAVLAEAVGRLKKGDDVMRYCVEAKKLEEEGDAIYHEALGALFDKEKDALEVMKWKEVYDKLEQTLDQAEDVANVLESITIKHG